MFVLPTVSLALDFRTGDNPAVGKSEVITDDLYIIGGSVTSAGEIAGDLLGGGGNIVVSGDVGGDIMLGGGNVTILSNTDDDVRVGGGTIVLLGGIGGDLVIAGGQVNVGGSGVSGDAVIAGGNIRIDAPIAGDVVVEGGNVYINSAIGGNVKIKADKVTLGGSAVISGNLTYKAKKELEKEAGADVEGIFDYEIKPAKKEISKGVLTAMLSAFVLWKFFALLASALLIGMIFRRYSNEVVKIATTRPILEVGRGLLLLAAMPVISILLFMTLVGVPFGVLGLLGFVMVLIFTWIVTPIIVGSVVYGYFSKEELEVSWKSTVIGVLVCTILGFIPFVGWLALKLLMLLTLGSMVALKLTIMKDWR